MLDKERSIKEKFILNYFMLVACMCDLSGENVHSEYPFERLKSVRLPFAMPLSCLSCLNGLGHPFGEIPSRSNVCCYPFEQNLHQYERLRLSLRINSSSVRTAEVIRSMKPFIRSNS